MTPSRERVEKFMYDFTHQQTLTLEDAKPAFELAKLYLSASEKLPAKYDIDKMKHGAVVSNTWREEGFNEAIDLCTPLVMRLQGRVEVLEKQLNQGDRECKHPTI